MTDSVRASSRGCYLHLDDAWTAPSGEFATIDASKWGPRLRFSAPPRLVEEFYRQVADQLPPFVLYGSGDFHHLTGLFVRRASTKPLVVLSFDNHPDWDIRPPKWCCGSWVNRALDLPNVSRVAVWGCGNFECWWPNNLFGNRRAERQGRLEVHPWADARSGKERQRRGAILAGDWRAHFSAFARQLDGVDVYVTIDLDCLSAQSAVTNWENGRFTVDDIKWALGEVRQHAEVIAGDICGAFSTPDYARRKQRFAARMDHPKLPEVPPDEVRRINQLALAMLWPALTDGNESDPAADQQSAEHQAHR